MGYKKDSEKKAMVGASIKSSNKALLKEFANDRGITDGKLASFIIESWIKDAQDKGIFDDESIRIKDLFDLTKLI